MKTSSDAGTPGREGKARVAAELILSKGTKWVILTQGGKSELNIHAKRMPSAGSALLQKQKQNVGFPIPVSGSALKAAGKTGSAAEIKRKGRGTQWLSTQCHRHES